MSLRTICLQFSATMIAQVTDELVEAILRSGLEPGAVDVVLEFMVTLVDRLPSMNCLHVRTQRDKTVTVCIYLMK